MRLPRLLRRKRPADPELSAGGPLESGTEFGVYHVEGMLGSGGFADVYLAVHRVLRRRVALKLIRPKVVEQAGIRDAFVREARVAAQFRHPNVVDIYDAGRGPGDRFFMALRYVAGGSVKDLIDREGPVPPTKALPLMRDICAGLAAIHDAGMIHRDIKPANILLDKDGRACVADLGLAGLRGERVPGMEGNEGSLSGTPLFLAPETFMTDDPPGPAADVYALGITFTALLTGEVPLSSLPLVPLLYHVQAGKLPDPQKTRPELDDDLADLLRELTAHDPADRPSSVAALVQRIEELKERREGRAPYAAPTGRDPCDEVAAVAARLDRNSLVTAILEACPGPALLLNSHRQVLTANDRTADLLETDRLDRVLGLRVGEALECEQAARATLGCGTGPVCRFCGLGRALSDAQQGLHTPAHGECRIGTGKGEAYQFAFDLRGVSTNGERMHLLALRDISAEKRRGVIGHRLVANLLEAATAMRSVDESVTADSGEGSELRVKSTVAEAGRALFEEAVFQQHLLAAEEGDLKPVPEECDVHALVSETCDELRELPVARGRSLSVSSPGELNVTTDRLLLGHALRALVKNALEASTDGDTVSVNTARESDGHVVIRVHNDLVMPPYVQAGIFTPSFSTRNEEGRGIGTYATRLFVETYLGGEVSFTSAEPAGTTFEIRLPIRAP